MCLLRRSDTVGSDRGKWHCVTGYLPPGIDPLRHAVEEIQEETGLRPLQLHLLDRAKPLRLRGGGRRWTVFPFLFEASSPVLQLNWENEDYRWVNHGELRRHDIVPWLHDVCRAVLPRRDVEPRVEASAA
jgi:8-oxo-dGTP pyrophosphatase MutT (NUDIX family)